MDANGSGVMDQVATFSSCTRSELDLLSFIGTEVAVEAGAVIMTENARSRECFVISSGRARVWRDGHDLGLIGTGEIFGEMSLLAGAPHPATVTAETPVELCVLSPAEFDSLMANAPSVIRKMMRERRRSLLS